MSFLPRTPEPEVMDTAEEADDYDSMAHDTVNAQFVTDLLQFMSPSRNIQKADHCVLDLGTGTAQIPIRLQQQFHSPATVIACDLSVEMLKVAARHCTESAHGSCILPALCDAKTLPVADQSCDVVMSNSIVHHIPDPREVFQEIRRVVSKDGVLFVRDLLRPATDSEVEGLVSTYAGDENSRQQQLFRQSLHAAFTISEIRSVLSDCSLNPDWVHKTSDRHWTVAGRC